MHVVAAALIVSITTPTARPHHDAIVNSNPSLSPANPDDKH